MKNERFYLLLFLLFFLSGFSALVYQVSWQRALFTLLGSNIESITIIVSVFMFGLGTGSLLGGSLSKRFPGKIIPIFAVIEASIGIYGFSSLFLMNQISHFESSGYTSTTICSFSLFLFPTLLMGATLPLLTTYINNRLLNAGTSVARLYLFNTAGSSLASLVTVFFFFELFGLRGTVNSAASLNIIVSIFAFSAYRGKV